MKRTLITLVACTLLFTANGVAQEKYTPFLVKESLKRNTPQMKSGITGSYPRHTEEFKWETDWVLFQKIETSYTYFGEPSVVETERDDQKTRKLFSYDSQNRETEQIDQALENGTWVNRYRDLITYETHGFVTEMRGEEWTGTDWVLASGFQVAYQMDGDQVKAMTSKSYNTETSTWDNMMRETYTYTGGELNFSSVVTDMWDNAWIPMTKGEYTWDGNMIASSLEYIYENNAWTLSTKTIYSFQSNTEIMTSYTYIGPDEWMPMARTTMVWDDHDNETLYQTEMYMQEWMVFAAQKFLLTYSGNDLTQRITQFYSMFPPALPGSESGLFFKNVLKQDFSNFASLGTDPSLLADAGLSIFPNPAGKQVVVHLPLVQTGTITISLISMSGQQIMAETLTASGSEINYQLDLSEVRPGSYLLVARDRQGRELGKTRLIKE